jgi:hypothetical protein
MPVAWSGFQAAKQEGGNQIETSGLAELRGQRSVFQAAK